MRKKSAKRYYWPNVLFIGAMLLLCLGAAPVYLWRFGLDPFQAGLFFFFFITSGLSITLGYHRLFSHRSFEGRLPVRFLSLLFGAAAFENSALVWASDHRRHHKFTDGDGDPYNIGKGFFYAHIGWVLEKGPNAQDYVEDLRRDPLVMWQHRHYVALAIAMGLVLPALIGGIWNGWTGALGGFLLAGVSRLVVVQQLTFFINSLCHSIGRQPYCSRGTARDSALMAVFTFGEGYHNFHHAFQHDYRNGVKAWQFDPTKWTIWLLQKVGLARNLRRVPQATILLAELEEQKRQMSQKLDESSVAVAESVLSRWQAAQASLQDALQRWEQLELEYLRILKKKLQESRERVVELRLEIRNAMDGFEAALNDWKDASRLIQSQLQWS